MKFKKTAIFIIICLGTINALKAQTYDELLKLTSTGKDITERLPSLAELQEKALLNSPVIKFYDAEIEVKNIQIKTEKREWMRNVGIESGAKYGLFDNLILTQDLGYNELTTAKTEQTRYNIGAFVRLPISAIADKSNVKIAKIETDKTKFQKQSRIIELKQLIINQYNNIIKTHRNLIVKTYAVETYRVQMLRAKKDFDNNLITISEYARLNDMLLKAVISLEDTKMEFQTAMQLLEQTVGERIYLKN